MNCSEVEELVPFYVAAVLPARDRAHVEDHLTSCEKHRTLIAQLRDAAIMPPPQVEEMELPPSLKGRIMAAAREEGRPALGPGLRLGRSLPVGVLAIVLVALLAWNLSLQLTKGGGADAFALPLRGETGAAGRVIYVGSEETGLLSSEGLAPLPGDQTYQVWAVTKKKGLESRGFLSVDGGGRGLAAISGDLDADLPIFVTAEPAGGSPRPSGAVVLTTKP